MFKLGAKVTAVDISGKMLSATVEPAAGGAAEKFEADVVLVSIGRVPYTEGLGLKEAGVALDNRGRVQIDRWRPLVRTENGFSMILWKQQNLLCALVSDLVSRDDLAKLKEYFIKVRSSSDPYPMS